jgi:hypothetical protein
MIDVGLSSYRSSAKALLVTGRSFLEVELNGGSWGYSVQARKISETRKQR